MGVLLPPRSLTNFAVESLEAFSADEECDLFRRAGFFRLHFTYNNTNIQTTAANMPATTNTRNGNFLNWYSDSQALYFSTVPLAGSVSQTKFEVSEIIKVKREII